MLFVTHDVDEAAFLGERILVMGAAPGRIVADIPVGLPRPRTTAMATRPDYLHCKEECLSRIREEVRASFGMA